MASAPVSPPEPATTPSVHHAAAGAFAGPVPPARAHYPALDGLRGLAILLVMVSHFVAPPAGGGRWGLVFRRVTDAGWVGVDLFFALSGFLITGILYDAKGKPHFFRNFFARRTLRVFPLYYGVLLLACVVLPALGLVRLTEPGRQWWLWLYATNFHPLVNGSGFGLSNTWRLQFGHFWSLAVEEHFYLVWPFVVFALTRGRLVAACVALMAGALALRIGFAWQGYPADVLYQTTFLRMDALAAGALAALLIRGPGGARAAVRPAAIGLATGAAGVVAVGLIAQGLGRYDRLVQTIGYSSLAVLFASAVLWTVARPDAWLARGALSARWLRALGTYSYGLYVFHFLLLPLFARVVPPPATPPALTWHFLAGTLAHAAFCAAASLAVAVASYHLFERQFLRLKRLFGG